MTNSLQRDLESFLTVFIDSILVERYRPRRSLDKYCQNSFEKVSEFRLPVPQK